LIDDKRFLQADSVQRRDDQFVVELVSDNRCYEHGYELRKLMWFGLDRLCVGRWWKGMVDDIVSDERS